MQFQVPQFIEAEDTIVGVLSLRQFGYLCLAGALSAVLYFTVNVIVWILFSLILVAVALILGFVQVQGQGMIRIIGAYARYFWNPQHYVWQSKGQPNTQKNDELKLLAPQGSPLEKVVLGFFLKQTWRDLQTGEATAGGTKDAQSAAKKTVKNEQYKIFRRLSGERSAARRIDYR